MLSGTLDLSGSAETSIGQQPPNVIKAKLSRALGADGEVTLGTPNYRIFRVNGIVALRAAALSKCVPEVMADLMPSR